MLHDFNADLIALLEENDIPYTHTMVTKKRAASGKGKKELPFKFYTVLTGNIPALSITFTGEEPNVPSTVDDDDAEDIREEWTAIKFSHPEVDETDEEDIDSPPPKPYIAEEDLSDFSELLAEIKAAVSQYKRNLELTELTKVRVSIECHRHTNGPLSSEIAHLKIDDARVDLVRVGNDLFATDEADFFRALDPHQMLRDPIRSMYNVVVEEFLQRLGKTTEVFGLKLLGSNAIKALPDTRQMLLTFQIPSTDEVFFMMLNLDNIPSGRSAGPRKAAVVAAAGRARSSMPDDDDDDDDDDDEDDS